MEEKIVKFGQKELLGNIQPYIGGLSRIRRQEYSM
jgi:hypothetical protein